MLISLSLLLNYTRVSVLDGKPHGQRSLAGYNPWCCKESDTTKRLTLSACEIKGGIK